MSAIVGRIESIEPHPNADRLELMHIKLSTQEFGEEDRAKMLYSDPTSLPLTGVRLVSGPHYREGSLGVYISPGSFVPGWLATHETEGLWLKGRGAETQWCLIESKNMRGVESPGVWAGSAFQKSREHPWQRWHLWQDHWVIGDDVAGYLGIRDPDRYDAVHASANRLAAEMQAANPGQRFEGLVVPAWHLITDEKGNPVAAEIN